MKAIKKHTRAEIESLVKDLLDWQNKHLQFRTGKFPKRERTLKPDEVKHVKSFFKRALSIQSQIIDFAKSLSPVERLRFPDFVIDPIVRDTTIANVLDYFQILIETLCKFRRNTLHRTESNQKPKTNTPPKYTPAVVTTIRKSQAEGKFWKEIATELNSKFKPKHAFTDIGLRNKWCDIQKTS